MSENGELEQERSWSEYRRLVLAELERIDKALTAINAKLDSERNLINIEMRSSFEHRDRQLVDLRVKMGMMEARAAIFGAITGLASSALLTMLVSFLTKRM